MSDAGLQRVGVGVIAPTKIACLRNCRDDFERATLAIPAPASPLSGVKGGASLLGVKTGRWRRRSRYDWGLLNGIEIVDTASRWHFLWEKYGLRVLLHVNNRCNPIKWFAGDECTKVASATVPTERA